MRSHHLAFLRRVTHGRKCLPILLAWLVKSWEAGRIFRKIATTVHSGVSNARDNSADGLGYACRENPFIFTTRRRNVSMGLRQLRYEMSVAR
jgi:hypothetical protein